VKPIVVIGAGIGGLSAAIRLAAAGRSVVVLEQSVALGGKMSEVREGGFRWDMGPSVITMRHVLEDLFASAGRKLDDYLTLGDLEPITRYFYPDGTVLDCSRDLPKMLEQIRALDERDVEGYLSYLAYAARLHRITGPVFIYDQPPKLASFMRVAPIDMLRVDPLRTMQVAINGFVHSPHMRQLLGRFATYVGASPYRAPATLNVIAHVELNEGIWYPRGGVYTIARALERLAGELGVGIRTNCGVEQIIIENGRAVGVVLKDGNQIDAEAVLANVDVATVYEKLLPASQRLRKLIEQESSCSGFILLLGIEGQHEQLATTISSFQAIIRANLRRFLRKACHPMSQQYMYQLLARRMRRMHQQAARTGSCW
jgi:diapolycopene oxygenase